MKGKGAILLRHRWRPVGPRYQSTSFVPPATWSIAKLGLQEQHESATIDVEVLCRRACLEPQPDLRQDVANMMHMLQQVSTASSSSREYAKAIELAIDGSEDSVGAAEAAAAIYDRPRGVTAAPVVTVSPSNAETEPIAWLETLRRTSMKRVGGHYYFEMETRSKGDDRSKESN